jgi:preprotein translocase subunit SecD
MERSWWWKAALYGVLTVLAVLYLVPTAYSLLPNGEEREPAILKKYFTKKIQLGLDLQGGLHLVYEVNVDKAVASKVDRLASDLEARLRKDKGVTDVTVTRESRDGKEDIVLTFKNPAD